MKTPFTLFILTTVVLLASCNKDDIASPSPIDPFSYDATPYDFNPGGLPMPNLPSDNLLTIAKVDLGRMLFYEKQLSGDNTMACADCHKQEDAFSDLDQFSIGINGLPGGRQAMAIFNMAWNENGFFWDGRAELLRHQALLPIQDPLEMDQTLEQVVNKLSNDEKYNYAFKRAFNSEEVSSNKVSLALEQFMFTIISNRSKYDKFTAQELSLSEAEERGMELFFGEYNPFFPDDSGADCAHCHASVNFENDLYMNNGLDSDQDFTDLGRYNVTELDEDKAKFKVPSLRNIELTFPYMHDGRFSTLEEVIDHYNEAIISSSTADPTVVNTMETGLMLTEEDKSDLIAFLKTLTDEELKSDSRYSNPF